MIEEDKEVKNVSTLKRRGRPPYKHLKDKNKEDPVETFTDVHKKKADYIDSVIKKEEKKIRVVLNKKDGSSLNENEKKVQTHLESILNSEEVKNKISDQAKEAFLYGKSNDLFNEFIKIHRVINISLGNKLFPIAAIDTDKFKKFCHDNNLECDKSFEDFKNE